MAGVIFAIVLASAAVVALVVYARRPGSAGPPAWLDRAALGVGALAMVALWVPSVESHLSAQNGATEMFGWLFAASIAIGMVALALGILAVASGRRSWQAWVGLAFGAVITGFWLVFFAGELLYPH